MILLGSNHYSSAVASFNTHSIDLEASSNQYLIRTDTNLSSNFPGKSTTGHTGDTTWEGWFNFEGTGAVRLFGKYATSQKCFYSVYSTNLMYFGISPNKINDYDKTWSWTPTPGTWYHLAFVYNGIGGQVEFFVNGLSQGTNTGYNTTLQQTTADFEIGDFTFRNAYFDGKIDDFRVWTVARTSTEIANNYNKELVGNESGLVGYWKFNNDATDSTSNGNDLTETNSPTYSTDVAFLSDNANTHSIDLEASSSQYLSITDASQTGLDITGDMTIEFWWKPESLNTFQYLISKWNSSGANQRSYLLLYNPGGYIQTAISTNGSSGTNSGTNFTYTYSTGTWYHIAVTYDASAGEMECFVNGVSIGTATGMHTSLYNGTAPFVVGANYAGSNNTDGRIDDVRIWNIKRTSTEIANNFNKELTGTEPNLQAYWKLNNSPNDLTSNANHLTETNSPVYTTDTPF